jgi:hypothetical protein
LELKQEYEKLFNFNQKKSQEIAILKMQLKSKENEKNTNTDIAFENQNLRQKLAELEYNMNERKNDEINDIKDKILEEARKIMQQQKQETELEIFNLKKLLMKRSKLLIDFDRKTSRFLERIANCYPILQNDIAAFYNQEFQESNESELVIEESVDFLKQRIMELEAENAVLFADLKVI